MNVASTKIVYIPVERSETIFKKCKAHEQKRFIIKKKQNLYCVSSRIFVYLLGFKFQPYNQGWQFGYMG